MNIFAIDCLFLFLSIVCVYFAIRIHPHSKEWAMEQYWQMTKGVIGVHCVCVLNILYFVIMHFAGLGACKPFVFQVIYCAIICLFLLLTCAFGIVQIASIYKQMIVNIFTRSIDYPKYDRDRSCLL